MSKLKVLTDSDFHSTVDSQDLVLVKFSATWCGPCKALAPVVDKIAEEVSYPIYEVDIDDAMDVAAEFKIRGVPTLIAFKNGKVHNRLSGVASKENILKLAE